MRTVVLPADNEHNLQIAREILSRGGVVVFPTDTVYGLGAAAFEGGAVEEIFRIKGRSQDKAIPILLSSAAEVDQVALELNDTARRLAQRFWPGPLTIVVAKATSVPDAVAGHSIGLRVPDHALARKLLAAAGPLAVTSANLSGRKSPVTAADVLDQLDGRVELVLDGGTTPGGMPSTVVDCTSGAPIILREGPVTPQAIKAALS